MVDRGAWLEGIKNSMNYCTNTRCLASTPKFYRVMHQGKEIDFGLCFRCAHKLLLTLPIEAAIEEEEGRGNGA